MNRRGFLQSCLIACAAPAIVRADSLMRILPSSTSIYVPNAGISLLVPKSVRASISIPRTGFLELQLVSAAGLRDALRYYEIDGPIVIHHDRYTDPVTGFPIMTSTARFNEVVHVGDE